jgi:AhpD family alkylhydroperoxidase
MRIPAAEPGTDPELAELFTKTVHDEDGQPLPIFTALAHHPKLLARFNSFGALLRNSAVTDLAHRELIVLRVAHRARCPFEFDQHLPLARAAGVTEPAIAAAVDQGPAVGAVDRLLLRLADELFVGDTVSDATWAATGEIWTPAQLLELVVTVGFFRLAAGLINAIGLRPEPRP